MRIVVRMKVEQLFPYPEWCIHKVYVFYEDKEGVMRDEDISRWFEPQHWEEDSKDMYGLYDRLEIRYSHHGKKFRKVVRPTEQLHFPPQKNRVYPSGVLIAHLVPRDIQEPVLDVTNRVQKYYGVDHAFGSMKAHDLFPFDDNEYNAEKFEALRIMYAHPTTGIFVDVIDYANNEAMAVKKN